jgi:opacity protein-like surface antigen
MNFSNNQVTFGFGLGTEINWNDKISYLVSISYVDLGGFSIGLQSNDSYVHSSHFNAIDFMIGFNYYF